jgi:type II secretion system protein N
MQVFGIRLPRPRLSLEWLGVLGDRLTWLYVAYTAALFVVFFILTFPHEMLVRRALSLVNTRANTVDFESTRFAWYKGYEINDVKLSGGSEGMPPVLELRHLWVRPLFSALIRGNPYAVHVQAELYGGEADGELNYTNGKLVGSLQLNNLEVGRYRALTALLDEGSITGRLSGQLDFEGRLTNLDGAQGSGDLVLESAGISQAKVSGYPVPDLNFRQSKLKFVVRSGRLELQDVAIAGDVNVQGSGQIILRAPMPDSVLNLRATLQPTGTTPDAVKALMAMIPKAPGAKPDAPMTITGTLSHPRVR